MTTLMPRGFKDTKYLLLTQPQNHIKDNNPRVSFIANIIEKYAGQFVTRSVRFLGSSCVVDETEFAWLAIGF